MNTNTQNPIQQYSTNWFYRVFMYSQLPGAAIARLMYSRSGVNGVKYDRWTDLAFRIVISYSIYALIIKAALIHFSA